MPALPAPLAILDVGGTEILIIMLVALLLFGHLGFEIFLHRPDAIG